VPAPIYTPANCSAAYQLDWSYTLFWNEPPADACWLPALSAACESDGIRILQHAFTQPEVSQFLISTRPGVVPQQIAQRVKGRLQHVLRSDTPSAFRRSYSLRGIGSTRREKLERYLAGQVEHHPLGDPRTAEQLKRFQFHDAKVDLSQPSHSTHAQYWHNLHIVLVNDLRGRQSDDEHLRRVRDMIVRASAKKGHLLSRAAILPDHLHLALRGSLEESPEEIVLGYMNNVAFACGMKDVLKYSYFVGAFSEYDLGVIPRP
jgi:hypothetical protein